MYPYYRCTDGKRVHIGRGEKQVNVLENDILAQLASAMAIIHVTDGLATTIATALSETHRHAQRAKQEAAAVYRAQLVDLDGRADRLYDRLDKGALDSEGYRRQTERLRQERDDLFEKLRDADRVADDEYLVTADRVLELAKSARTLWDQHLPEQQRDLLSAVVCNPRLDQRTVRFDLQKPFEVLVKMRLNAEWRPQRELNSKKRHFVKWRCRSSFVASF
jgi:hypothetical protein